jgi:PepSY-associated TM region
MKLLQLLGWRFSLIFFHRWLGIAVGLMFIVWTVSGVILMYYGIPHQTAGERLARLPPLDLSTVTVTPAQALAKVGGTPFRLRIAMLDGRPVYRINSGQVFGNWTVVFADDGDLVRGLTRDQTVYTMAKLYPEHSETMRYINYLRAPDQFTHSPALQTHLPLHVLRMENGEDYYVAETSGEVVMHTTYLTRVLGFLGYNLHTLYFWRQASWWTPLLHALSWAGLGMTVLGIVLGIWRFTRKPSFIQNGVAYRTPYSGWWRWHHYAGLIFGVVMCTWMLSGLISLSVFPSITESFYTPAQLKAGARTVQGFGAPVDLAPLTIAGMQEAVRKIGSDYPVKELELQYYNEQPYYVAYRAPNETELAQWVSRSALDFLTPTLEWEHRFIAATDLQAQPFTDFAEADLLQAAATAMPDQQYSELTWLTEPDDYYYHTVDSFDLGLPRSVRTFPVLRLKYADTHQTWLYLTPSHAQLIKAELSDRRNRWGYYGLHGFDFAFLYNNRPLWDIVVLLLLIGCITMAVTVVEPAWERLKKHYFHFISLFG